MLSRGAFLHSFRQEGMAGRDGCCLFIQRLLYCFELNSLLLRGEQYMLGPRGWRTAT